MDNQTLEKLLFGSHEKAEEFYEAMNELAKIWPIGGFRCSGAPYITNQDEIDAELARRKEKS